MGTDKTYYERRLLEERTLAATACGIEERRFHESLAALYAQRLDGGTPDGLRLRD